MNLSNSKEIVKMLLMKENLTVTKLAAMLSQKGKKYYQQTLSAKILKGTLKANELIMICDLLGYDMEFVKRSV